jgi:glycosyltransferase involved in cell wall biosynthesis
MNHSTTTDSVNRRVLLINQTPGEGFRSLASKLTASNIEVEAICGTREQVAFYLPVDINAVNEQPPRFGERFTVYRADSVLSRLSTWLRFTRQAARVLRTLNADDVVLATSNPPLLPLVASLAKRKRGFRLVTRVLDQYPEVLYAIPSLKRFATLSGIGLLWTRLQSWALTVSDEVVAMGPCMAAAIKATAPKANVSYAAEPPDRDCEHTTATGDVLQCGLDLRTLNDKAVVLFAGNIGLTHDSETLRRTITEITKSPRAAVVLVGAAWETLARSGMHVQPCLFLPHLVAHDYSALLERADIAVVAVQKGLGAASFPSRLASFACHGVAAVLATDEPSDAAALVREHECGIVVPAGDAAELTAAVLSLVEDRALCMYLKRQARKAAFVFNAENTVNKVVNAVLRQIQRSL